MKKVKKIANATRPKGEPRYEANRTTQLWISE